MLEKQFLGAKIHIFEKTFISFRLQIFYELIPNLLGHPVEVFDPFNVTLLVFEQT